MPTIEQDTDHCMFKMIVDFSLQSKECKMEWKSERYCANEWSLMQKHATKAEHHRKDKYHEEFKWRPFQFVFWCFFLCTITLRSHCSHMKYYVFELNAVGATYHIRESSCLCCTPTNGIGVREWAKKSIFFFLLSSSIVPLFFNLCVTLR